jgi:hypothetical protein
MSSPTIGVVITGRSDVGQVLAATDKQLEGFRRQTERTSRQVQKMTQTSGLETLTKGFKGVTGQSFEFYKNVTRTVDSLGVLTGAGSIAGVLALSKSISGLGQSQLNASRGINMGAHQLVGWQNAAKSAGSSADSATSSIAGMEKAVTRMTLMGGKEMGVANQALGAGWQNKYKTDTDKFLAISKYVSGLHGDAKAEAMEQLEGAFSITPDFMQDVLARGPDYVQKELAKGLTAAPTNSQLGSLSTLSTSFGDLENSISGAAETGAASIAPVLIPALNSLSTWIDHHQKSFDVFAATLGGILTGLGHVGMKRILGGGKPTVRPSEAPPAGATPGIWSRLLPLGAGATDLALGGLVGAGIALWPETPGNDTLRLGRGQMKRMAPNAAVIAATMRAQGAPASFIDAALGNFAWETGGTLDPHQKQAGGGPGFGIAQWEGPRQALFKQVEGVDIHQATIQQETDFFLREMQHNYPQTYAQLMSGKLDTKQATKLFMQSYEAPKDKDDPTGSIVPRTSYAEQFGSLIPSGTGGSGMGAENRSALASANMTLAERAAAVAAADPQDDPGVSNAIHGMSAEDRSGELHVYIHASDGAKVTTRQKGAPGVKTVTAMPTAGGLY